MKIYYIINYILQWNSGVLLHIGWSDGEQLLCIQESGDVLIYDMFGAYQKTFNMGQEVRDTKVCSFIVILVYSTSNVFLFITNKQVIDIFITGL